MILRAIRKWHPLIFCLFSFWSLTWPIKLHSQILSNEIFQWTLTPAANWLGFSKWSAWKKLKGNLNCQGTNESFFHETASRLVSVNSNYSWERMHTQTNRKGEKNNDLITERHLLRPPKINDFFHIVCDQNFFYLSQLKYIKVNF